MNPTWEVFGVGWGRNCPSCNKVIIHRGPLSKYNATKSHKNSKRCFNCSNSDKTQINILNKDVWFENSFWCRKCPKCDNKITQRGKNAKAVISFAHRKMRLCRSCANSHIFSDSTREKMRNAIIKRVEKYGILSRHFNPRACKFIDEFGKQNGYNFRHALNGGEVIVSGYRLDGYDKEKNAIFEYDEPIHETPSHKSKDTKRQKTIIDMINPSIFIRYREKTNTLFDVIENKEIV